MLIIYSVSGLLWSVIAVAVGILLFMITGRALPALFIPSLILLFSGRLNKRFQSVSILRAKPSIFFIPLFVYGMLGMALSIFVGYAAVAHDLSPKDQRQLSLEADYAKMNAGEKGDAGELADRIAAALRGGEFASVDGSAWTVYARANAEAVLVVCKNIKLNKLPENGRTEVLGIIEKAIAERKDLNGKAAYIGLKGMAMYGAIKTPETERLKLSKEEYLLPFYGKEPANLPKK